MFHLLISMSVKVRDVIQSFRRTPAHIRLAISIILAFSFLGCSDSPSTLKDGKVCIRSENNRYVIYRNGKPFSIKGASGFTNLETLKEAGGNTIRTWDTTNLARILTEAEANQLAVVVGLPMPESEEMDSFYNRPELVEKQLKSYSALINKYKDHPAVLFWCVGNEIPFPYKPKFNKFYDSFNAVVDMIHLQDPNHPVTTTVLNVQQKNIINIKLRTNIDFVSFNIFGAIRTLKQDLKKAAWIWKGPYLITEWGIDGPWNTYQQTAWAAYIENTSTKKAELLLERYRQFMPVDDPRFLGSLVFFWGQKQETTKTWFSLFDEDGAATESVDAMRYIWTSRLPERKAPQIRYMLLNDKGARDNIMFNPGEAVSAKLFLDQLDTVGLTYTWEIQAEDWYKENGKNNTKKMKSLDSQSTVQGISTTKFVTPEKEGPYRLFVFVKDQHGKLSTSNTPFYVIEK